MTQTAASWREGDALEPLTLPPVTRLDLIKYAGASGDYNPIHTIDEEAEKAGLPGVIQHGMLTMAQIGRLFSPHLGKGWFTRFHIRFRGMVFVGDELTIRATVTSVESTPEGPVVTFDLATETADKRSIASGTIAFQWLEEAST